MSNAGYLKVKPSGQAGRVFGRLKAALDDLRPAMQSTAQELTRRIRYRFDFKRDPDNQRWAPWAASTAYKNRNKPGSRLMMDSRLLRDSSHFVATRRGLQAVITMPYGKYHEQPRGNGTGRLPRRAFLLTRNRDLSPGDRDVVFSKVRYQLQKAASK